MSLPYIPPSTPSAFQQQQQEYHTHLAQLELQHMAAADPGRSVVNVPTLAKDVQTALRRLGLPIRLFGENAANVRDRLRMELLKRQQQQPAQSLPVKESRPDALQEAVTKYTRASPELIEARRAISEFSLLRARQRLERERLWRQAAQRRKQMESMDVAARAEFRESDLDQELSRMDQSCLQRYKQVKALTLQGSQYGDTRTISCIVSNNADALDQPSNDSIVATSSWTGTVKLWNARSPALPCMGSKALCHEDRIMHIDLVTIGNEAKTVLATASLDKTAKLWSVTRSDDSAMGESDRMDTGDANHHRPTSQNDCTYSISHQATLSGHVARLCRVGFHPLRKHVATTSCDYSWRLWDIQTGQCLLLQDGHYRECYGLGFHPDGSLVATSDYAGVTHLWDIRTSKSIHHWFGHAKRVLQTQFAPNGFQLATAGDDGTIKVWDLRQRKMSANVPAHSNLITCLKFMDHEVLASASFDGSVKLWSCRSWKMLQELRGHEGKVTGVDFVGTNVVTSGFDKTLKLWS